MPCGKIKHVLDTMIERQILKYKTDRLNYIILINNIFDLILL